MPRIPPVRPLQLAVLSALASAACASSDASPFGAYAGTWQVTACSESQQALPETVRPCPEPFVPFLSITPAGAYEFLTDTLGEGVPSLPNQRLVRAHGQVRIPAEPHWVLHLEGENGLLMTRETPATFPPSDTPEPAVIQLTYTRRSARPVDLAAPLEPSAVAD